MQTQFNFNLFYYPDCYYINAVMHCNMVLKVK